VKAKQVIEKLDQYLLKPFKSKENFKQFIKDIKERIKDIILFRSTKGEATAQQANKKSWLNAFGIDSDKIKTTIKREGFNLMLWGNVRINSLNSGMHETQL
jgi:hypothetical protein